MMEREKETYRDCMRNHAATLGTYATDGCGEYTPDPDSPAGMQCAACGCHRNFHRKVPLESSATTTYAAAAAAAGRLCTSEGGKRRVRTKFSAEQKDRMLRFSEKIGWRIPRRDGDVDEVGDFCREIGVTRQIFKVWMHNHKSNGGGNVTDLSAGAGGSSSSPPSAAAAAAAAIVAAANAGNVKGNGRAPSSFGR